MTDAHDADPAALAVALSDDLLSISQRALAGGLFETAYHALAGALHAAESGADGERLRVIQEQASRQQEHVDAEASEHRLSRRSGHERGHAGWYDALALQAKAALLALRSATAIERIAAVREMTRAVAPPAGEPTDA